MQPGLASAPALPADSETIHHSTQWYDLYYQSY